MQRNLQILKRAESIAKKNRAIAKNKFIKSRRADTNQGSRQELLERTTVANMTHSIRSNSICEIVTGLLPMIKLIMKEDQTPCQIQSLIFTAIDECVAKRAL